MISSYVSKIIDLRSAYELRIEANPFASPDQTTALPMYQHLPLLDEDNHEAMTLVNTNTATVSEMYYVMLEHFTSNIGAIIQGIVETPPDSAVVIHCHAGKDRTGLIAALALRLVGISADDIAADYALSDAALKTQNVQMLDQKSDPEERAQLSVQLETQGHVGRIESHRRKVRRHRNLFEALWA